MLFRHEEDDDGKHVWTNYSKIKSRGFISGNRLSKKFAIVEDNYIKFIELDDDNNPVINNVMYNFIKCSMMIFES